MVLEGFDDSGGWWPPKICLTPDGFPLNPGKNGGLGAGAGRRYPGTCCPYPKNQGPGTAPGTAWKVPNRHLPHPPGGAGYPKMGTQTPSLDQIKNCTKNEKCLMWDLKQILNQRCFFFSWRALVGSTSVLEYLI